MWLEGHTCDWKAMHVTGRRFMWLEGHACDWKAMHVTGRPCMWLEDHACDSELPLLLLIILIFREDMQRILVVTDVSGQSISPIFKGKAVKEEFFLDGLILEDGSYRMSQNFDNHQSTLRNIPEERRFLLHRVRSLKLRIFYSHLYLHYPTTRHCVSTNYGCRRLQDGQATVTVRHTSSLSVDPRKGARYQTLS